MFMRWTRPRICERGTRVKSLVSKTQRYGVASRLAWKSPATRSGLSSTLKSLVGEDNRRSTLCAAWGIMENSFDEVSFQSSSGISSISSIRIIAHLNIEHQAKQRGGEGVALHEVRLAA